MSIGNSINSGAIIVLGGSFTMSGAFTFSGTLTANTSITFPVSGTLATTAAIPALPISLANGGSGASLSAVNGGVVYSNASTMAISTTLPATLTIPQPNIVGVTTNSNATAGSVGELISSVVASASSVSCTNTTPRNVTTISLTAGDWDIYGNVGFTYSTPPVAVTAWASLTSATLPDLSLYSEVTMTTVGAGATSIVIPFVRVSIAVTTTVYLSCDAFFAGGTVTACGGIYARRVR